MKQHGSIAGALAAVEGKIVQLQTVATGLRAYLGQASSQDIPKKHHRLSAAGRKAIGDAARRRWAKTKAAKK
jgi:allophanate hydrolase subunit 2